MMSRVTRFFSRFSVTSVPRGMILVCFALVLFYLLQLSKLTVDKISVTINETAAKTNTASDFPFNSVPHDVVQDTSDKLESVTIGKMTSESYSRNTNKIATKFKTLGNNHSEPVKRILWYVPPHYVQSTDKGELRPLKACPDLPCVETTDKDLIAQADAVIFDVHKEIHPKQLPLKHPNQVWIVFAQESPNYIIENITSSKWGSVFNWTCTYRRDSDIWMPYGLIEKRTQLPEKDYDKIVKRKSKMASWLVSHCKSQSERHAYVQLLEKYGLETDIFGNCGKQICPRTIDGHDECRHISTGEYSFYFGFENSLCKDYVTEKLFDYFNEDIILVVRGGKGNYKHYPTGIFINTEDFKNVSELASYMKDLHINKTKYVEFLKRKDEYKAVEETFTYKVTHTSWYTHYHYLSEPMCDMCRKLLKGESKPKVYKDIHSWFNNDVCHPPTDLN